MRLVNHVLRAFIGRFVVVYLYLDGFLFRENKLCVPNCSRRELLVQESHSGGLMGHFGVAKTLAILQEHFYWPHMKRDVERICGRCVTCRQAKSKVQPNDGKRKADFVKQIHEKARLNIERRTEQYATQANKGRCNLVFEPGDWVWLHMRKERFPAKNVPNCSQEEMVLSKSSSVSMTTLTSLIYLMSTM